MSSPVLNTNLLTLSLPPESQQFIGSALDLNELRTAIFMSGSANLPRPSAPTRTYNPSFLKPITTANGTETLSGSAQTLLSGLSMKMDGSSDTASSTIPSPISKGFYSNDAFLTPGNGHNNAVFDFQGEDFAPSSEKQGINEQLDGSPPLSLSLVFESRLHRVRRYPHLLTLVL